MSTSKMSRACPVKGCTAMIPKTKIMCKRDWMRVPDSLKQSLHAAARSTDGEFQSSIKAVIVAANAARNGKKQQRSDGTVTLDVEKIVVTVPAQDAADALLSR